MTGEIHYIRVHYTNKTTRNLFFFSFKADRQTDDKATGSSLLFYLNYQHNGG